MMSGVTNAIEWAQALSSWGKSGVTGLLLVIFVGLVVILWQRPNEKRPVPGSNIQSGNVTSNGQSGGITIGQFINQPPVTDLQKENAVTALKAEIGELKAFPNLGAAPERANILEGYLSNKKPVKLFGILAKYYPETIKNVPRIVNNHMDFKKKYYDITNKECSFENRTIELIGTHAESQIRTAWEIAFRYYVVRASGASQQNIAGAGNFLNYGLTWDKVEEIYNWLSSQNLQEEYQANLAVYVLLTGDAENILSSYQE